MCGTHVTLDRRGHCFCSDGKVTSGLNVAGDEFMVRGGMQ